MSEKSQKNKRKENPCWPKREAADDANLQMMPQLADEGNRFHPSIVHMITTALIPTDLVDPTFLHLASSSQFHHVPCIFHQNRTV